MGWRCSEQNGSQNRRASSLYLLFPFVTLAVLWYGADLFLSDSTRLQVIAPLPVAIPEPLKVAANSKAIVLKTDLQGHFRGTAFINNVAMPFLVDTGATKTSIPSKLAVAAGLPVGNPIQSHTAGGMVIEHLTRINSLKIGNVEIRNLDADINHYLDEVLMGMNTLKYFQMTQIGDTLTMVAIKQSGNSASTVQVFDKPQKKHSP